MFAKTLIAATTFAVSLAALGVGAASAGGYNYRHSNYSYQPSYQQTYQPVYKTVCEPVYATQRVYDPYLYRYVTKTVFVRNDCYQVLVY